MYRKLENKGMTTIEITLLIPVILLATLLAIWMLLWLYGEAKIYGEMVSYAQQKKLTDTEVLQHMEQLEIPYIKIRDVSLSNVGKKNQYVTATYSTKIGGYSLKGEACVLRTTVSPADVLRKDEVIAKKLQNRGKQNISGYRGNLGYRSLYSVDAAV